MDDLNFDSITDLYNRLKPALSSKAKELHLLKKIYISEKDIFEYLSKECWNNGENIALCDMVNDIMCIDIDALETYMQNKILKKRTEE